MIYIGKAFVKEPLIKVVFVKKAHIFKPFSAKTRFIQSFLNSDSLKKRSKMLGWK